MAATAAAAASSAAASHPTAAGAAAGVAGTAAGAMGPDNQGRAGTNPTAFLVHVPVHGSNGPDLPSCTAKIQPARPCPYSGK